MRAHQIQNGVVINTIEVDSLDVIPGLIEATEGSIGWLWDGESLTAPPPAPPVVPQVVTMRQARLALLGAGLLSGVAAAINAMDSPQKEAAQIEWEYSQTVERQRGFVLLLGGALGLTSEQLDNLFITAGTL